MKLEYIWLDGNKVQLLRSKTKIWNTEKNFSTDQADCGNSEKIPLGGL
jgi:hypothetical protein